MENPSSPLDTLRQLKEMLDAGALTPTEFEALKQRLVFAPVAPGPAAAEAPSAPSAPAVPVIPVAPLLPIPAAASASEESATTMPPSKPATFPSYTPPNSPFPTPAANEEAAAHEPALEAMPMPSFLADFQIAAGDSRYMETEALADDDALDTSDPPTKRNSSLGLVLAIGAVLVFLAVVAYLGFTRPVADEHISSISQTAADSLNTTIETGPQVAPLPATTTAPETVRVAPTNPAPIIQPRPSVSVADSVAPAVKSSVSDSVGNQ